MGALFISYRRGDAEGQARALATELEEIVGKDSIFMDVDSIGLGRDFRQVLQERLQACDYLLALIGPNWLDAKDASGRRRLDHPGDLVHQEIATALKRNIPVVPVLILNASMPSPEALPKDLQDLAYRNGFELSHTRWRSDVYELASRLGLTPHRQVNPVSPVRAGEASPPPALLATPRSVDTEASPWPSESAMPQVNMMNTAKEPLTVPVHLVVAGVPIGFALSILFLDLSLLPHWIGTILTPVVAAMFYAIFRINTVKAPAPAKEADTGLWIGTILTPVAASMFHAIFRINKVKAPAPVSRDSILALSGSAMMTFSFLTIHYRKEIFGYRDWVGGPIGVVDHKGLIFDLGDSMIFAALFVFLVATLGGSLLVIYRHRWRTRIAREAAANRFISM